MTFAAKLGAMIMTPFMAFGGFGNAMHTLPARADTTSSTPSSSASVLRISDVTGPTSLAVDQDGTWTVDVKETGTSSLQYSVQWGDEGSMLRANAVLPSIATSSATFTHAYSTKGTYHPVFTVTNGNGITVRKTADSVQVGKNSVAHIDSITPGTGQAGTMVTLAGSGFASSSAVHFGDTTITDASVQNANTISFSVPSTTPSGTYKVWVKGNNSNQGKSNAVNFTVTQAAKTHLSVNGIDAPVTLVAGTDGTWTVHASTNGPGSLHYSVKWGDEDMMARAMSLVASPTTQTSATFTHAYDSAGSYQPTFTITDDAGHSTTASASVQVTDQ